MALQVRRPAKYRGERKSTAPLINRLNAGEAPPVQGDAGLRVAIVGLMFALVAAGCGSDTPTSPGGSNGSPGSSIPGGILPNHGTMTATIDGVRWTASIISQPIRINGPGGPQVTLSGTDLTTTVTIGIAPLGSAGTYTTNPSAATNVQLQDRVGIWAANNLKGTATIGLASISPASATTFTAKGSFSATVVGGANTTPGSRSITGGSFDITY